MSLANPSTFRRRAGAALIVAFFAALLASTLLQPTDSHSTTDQLRAAAAHPGAMQAAAWCEILAGILAPVVVLTLVHVVGRRGATLAHLGGILGILGSVGTALIGVHALFIVALAQRGDQTSTAVLDRLDHLAPAIIVLFFALPIALALLAAATARARLAPRWVVPAAIVFVVIDFTPLPGGEIIQMLIGLATFGSIAYRILAPETARQRPRQLAASPGEQYAAARREAAVPPAAAQDHLRIAGTHESLVALHGQVE